MTQHRTRRRSPWWYAAAAACTHLFIGVSDIVKDRRPQATSRAKLGDHAAYVVNDGDAEQPDEAGVVSQCV